MTAAELVMGSLTQVTHAGMEVACSMGFPCLVCVQLAAIHVSGSSWVTAAALLLCGAVALSSTPVISNHS